jgi:hypothetical protein
MRVPQIAPLAGMAPLGFKEPTAAANEKTLAERKWQAPTRPAKPQKPCDIGLFSDDHLQLDLVEMFQDPTND